MRESKKGDWLSQKLYYIVCGIGFFILIVLMVIYANQMKNKNQIANKEIHLDEVGNQAIQKQKEQSNIKANKENEKKEKEKQVESTNENSTQKKKIVSKETLSYDGKEKLSWPAKGNIILPYSMDTTVYFQTLDQYKCNKGMLIEAKKGQDIVAPGKCKVVEVSKNEEIGNQVLLDLGNDYTMVLGQLEGIKVKVEDVLNEGDRIGSVAEPTKYYTLEGNHLYIEMLHKDTPVNPLKYLKE